MCKLELWLVLELVLELAPPSCLRMARNSSTHVRACTSRLSLKVRVHMESKKGV